MKYFSMPKIGFLMAMMGLAMAFQNCSQVGFREESAASIQGVTRCEFDGKKYEEGEFVIAYLTSSVPAGQSCQYEKRVCTNGSFTGSYPYSSCTPGAPASCIFNGRTIAHNESVTAYQASSVPHGQTCVSEVRTCNNGTLSGSYGYASCSVNPAAKASCEWGGKVVPDGQWVKAYAVGYYGHFIQGQPESAYGFHPLGEKRTCKQGVLSGSFKCQNYAQVYNWDDCIIYYEVKEIPKDSVPLDVSEWE